MKCPVCKNEINENSTFCSVCNFSELNKVFVNVEDANEWKNTVLAHYRALWLLKKEDCNPEIDLTSQQSIEIFKKYCTDNNHFFRFKNLIVNTKFASFIWEQEENGHPKRECQIFGYEYFKLEYDLDGNDIIVRMRHKENKDEIHGIATITTTNTQTRREILTVFEFMKTGGLHFEYAFDEDKKWYTVKNTDNYYVMNNYFSGTNIEPILFYARYIEADDSDFETPVIDYGLQEIQFSVENENGTVWNLSDMKRNAPKRIKITMRAIDTGKITKKWIYLDDVTSINTKDDLYINEETKSVFIGELHSYEQYQFDDLIMARRIFDYLMILFSHTI